MTDVGSPRLVRAFGGAEVMAFVTHHAMPEVPWLRLLRGTWKAWWRSNDAGLLPVLDRMRGTFKAAS